MLISVELDFYIFSGHFRKFILKKPTPNFKVIGES